MWVEIDSLFTHFLIAFTRSRRDSPPFNHSVAHLIIHSHSVHSRGLQSNTSAFLFHFILCPTMLFSSSSHVFLPARRTYTFTWSTAQRRIVFYPFILTIIIRFCPPYMPPLLSRSISYKAIQSIDCWKGWKNRLIHHWCNDFYIVISWTNIIHLKAFNTWYF